MKALSLIQPWATIVILGVKRYETRSWRTGYRGPLVIHASGRFPRELRGLCGREPFQSILQAAGFESWADLPLGVVLGTVELSACQRVNELSAINGVELALGDYRSGRWAWLLENAQALPEPIPWKGKRGVYDIPDSVLPCLVEACP
jgi:activating signal cointegrator 1